MSHSPSSRSALIDLVHQWHQSGTPWSPSGLGTRLDWGPPRDPRHEVLSCRQLDRVIDKHLRGKSGEAAKGLLKKVLGGS